MIYRSIAECADARHALLLGFGGSQLFYGALSDAVGRRPTFLLGQGIYLLGTVLCVMMSDHFQALEFGRLLQD